MISFTNISGAAEIGSNCYLLNINGTKIVLDSGMHPKKEGSAAMPDFDMLEPDSVSAIFLSHSHLDHLGTLPVLQEKQSKAQVFMTVASVALSEVMLHNSVNVMSAKRLDLGIVEYPLFTHDDVERLSEAWQGKPCNESFRIGEHKNILATLFDAGHILGSAGIWLESETGHTIFYTGDVQLESQSMIPGADFPESGVDTLIMECTRGGVHRSEQYTRENELNRFAAAINQTLQNGGAVLIPVFAIGKSQEMLYNIHRFKLEGKIPPATPVHFGGLSAKVTGLYDRFAEYTPRHDPDFKIRDRIQIVPLSKKGKKPLLCSPGNIYVISSGMMTEKTLSNVLAEQFLPQKKNAILFVGYTDPDSPAGILKATPHGELVRMHAKAQPVRKECRVESFDFSGHSARHLLVQYACRLRPKQIVLVHGDPDAVEWMQRELQSRLPQTAVINPEPGQPYTLQS